MPTYNSEDTVRRAIDSILGQTYKTWELLITDDNSSDKTVARVKQYTHDSRIKLYLSDKNCGAGIARNNSIKKSKGRFIAFCDSDDYWLSDKLEVQIPFMINNSISLSFTDYFIDNGQGKPMQRVNSLKFVNYKMLIRTNYIGCLTAIYDTEFVGKAFMSPVRRRQDWILWLEILSKTDKALSINRPLSIYNNSNQSLSSNKLKLFKSTWYVYRKHLQYSYLKSSFSLLAYIYYYLKKKKLIKKT